MSPQDGGEHVIYEEIPFFHDSLYLSQLGFLITSFSPWPNRNWLLSALISHLLRALWCLYSFPRPAQRWALWTESTPPSHVPSLFTSSSVQFRNREVLGRVTGFRKLGSLLVRKEERTVQGRKFSSTQKGICWALESLQAMRGCLQSWGLWGRRRGAKQLKNVFVLLTGQRGTRVQKGKWTAAPVCKWKTIQKWCRAALSTHRKLNLSHSSTTKRVCWYRGHFLAVLDKCMEEHLILVNCTGLPWPLEKKVLKAGCDAGCQTNFMKWRIWKYNIYLQT